MLVGAIAAGAAYAQRDTVSVADVVVTGTRSATDVRHLPFTVNIIDRQKLTENYQNSIMPTVMQQVPGMMVTSRSVMGYGVAAGAAGGINLRGISGGTGQLLVLIDGHPQYNGIYGHPISDSYQTLMAERVEVLRGPASVLYGSNAMGGVINIVTRGMHRDGVQTTVNAGAGSYGTVQTEVGNQVRSGKFSSTVAAQYNRTDNHRPHMGFEQYGGYLKLGYDFHENWDAYVNADITHFNSQYSGSTSAPVYGAGQWITRAGVAAAVQNHYEKTNGAINVYSNFGRHKIDDGSSNAATPTNRYFRSKDNLAGVSLFQSVSLFEGARLTAGVDYQHVYGRAYYTSKETGGVLDTPNKQSGKSHRNEIAGYVDYRQDVTSWMTVDAGLRFDHHNVTGSEWIPQMGLVFRPAQNGEVKLMAGKGFRNPTMREMYLYPTSNEELRPERLWNYELAWKQHLSDIAVSYGVNLYYIKGDNMIQTIERHNVNTGEVENCGLELEASWRINGHWAVNTNHSFLHMEHKVISAPEYKGFADVEWTGGRWQVNGGLQYIDRLFTAVGDNEQTQNFWLLNTTVSYCLFKGLRLWARGENLLAQEYETLAGYPMPRATFMGGLNFSF